MRVLVFGASTTQGYWDTEGGWVARLRKYYDLKQVRVQSLEQTNEAQPVVFNLGISADTTELLLKRFEAETLARQRPEMAFIFHIGGNDAALEHGNPRSTPDKYKKSIEALIENAKKFSNRIIFIDQQPCDESRTTPVFWADVHYTNQRFEEFNNILHQVCEAMGVMYVPTFETLQEEITKGRKLFVDGLHPNNEGHALIFQLVRPELDKLLQKSEQ